MANITNADIAGVSDAALDAALEGVDLDIEGAAETVVIPGGTPAAPAPTATATTSSKKSTEEKYEELHKTLASQNIEGSKGSYMIEAGSPKWALQTIMSEMASVCGFIVPTNVKQDIVLQKIKTTEGQVPKYHFGLTEKMNRKILGVVIRYPEALLADIANAPEKRVASDMSMEELCADLLAKARDKYKVGDEGYTVQIMDYAKAIDFICAYCRDGEISEAPSLFIPHTVNVPGGAGKPATKKNIMSIADMGKKSTSYTLQDKAADIYAKYQEAVADFNAQTDKDAASKAESKVKSLKNKLNDSTKLWPMKSRYRGTALAAEGNYIAAAKFQTEVGTAVPTPEAIEAFNTNYIAPLLKDRKYTPSQGSAPQTIKPEEYLQDDAVTEEGGKITYGGIDGATPLNQSLAKMLNGAKHCSGISREIKADEINLVKKTVVKTTAQDGTQRSKTTIEQIPFGEEGNKFQATGEHKGIADAITTDVTEFEKSLAVFIKKATEKSVSRGGSKKSIKTAAVDRIAMKRLLRNVTEARFEH